MKQIFQVLLFSSFLIFSGCFGSDEKDQEMKNLDNIVEYSINIPKEWEVFPKKEYPKSLVFSAKEPAFSSRFPAVLAIAKENSVPDSLNQFISRNLEEVRRNSQDFKKISEKEIPQSADEENRKSRLVEYRERRSADNSFFGIFSYYLLPENKQESYVVTMIFDPDISDEKKAEYEKIITSFHLKKGINENNENNENSENEENK